MRRTVGYLTAISRKQQGPKDCSGNTSLVPTHNLRVTGEQRRERVTKVAHECLCKASVAEQIRWDVTVEEM